jgi:hypothetical protein
MSQKKINFLFTAVTTPDLTTLPVVPSVYLLSALLIMRS